MYDRRPKSNFCGLSASEQAKARATRRSGIWLQILVAFGWDVTFVKAGHPNSLPYPIVAFAPRFCIGSSPRAAHSLNKTSTGACRLLRDDIQRFCFEIYVSKSKFPHTLQQPARGPWAFQKQAIFNSTPLVFSRLLSIPRARGRYIINFFVIWRSICAGGTLTRAKKCDTIKNGKLCAKTVLRCGIV